MSTVVQHPGHTHDVGRVNPASELSPEDVAEYQARIIRAQDNMRDRGFDALVVASPSATWHKAYTLYFTGFQSGYRWPDVVLIPQSGDVTLVVNSGMLRSVTLSARVKSWVPNLVSTYREDRVWETETNFGLHSDEMKDDIVQAIRDAGLAASRIGLVGEWPNMEQTIKQLPNARFEPADQLLEEMTTTYSAWEIAKIEQAQRGVDAAIAAYMNTAKPGVLHRDAVLEAIYVGGKQGADVFMATAITAPGEPWLFGLSGLESETARFKKGDLITGEFIGIVKGYSTQTPRSWVLGEPTKTQAHVLETTKGALDIMLERLRPGVTAAQMWELSMEISDKANLDQWCRSGHVQGLSMMDDRFDFFPQGQTPIVEGQALVVHPMFIDKAAMVAATYGDTVITTSDGCRFVSEKRVYAFGTEL